MKTINELVEDRRQAVIEWNKLKMKIDELTYRIKDGVLQTIINMGLYREKWVYDYNDNLLSYQSLTIVGGDINDSIQTYLFSNEIDTITLDDGILLGNIKSDYAPDQNLRISTIQYSSTSLKEFIKKNNLKIDTRRIDDKISWLQKQKNELL